MHVQLLLTPGEAGAVFVVGAYLCAKLRADVLLDEFVERIRSYLKQRKVLGMGRFRSWVEARISRFVTVRRVGRLPGR